MTATIARYCLCGAVLRGRVSPGESAAGLLAMFGELHSGPGCGEATAAQAAAARRRRDREIEREWARGLAG